MIEIRFLLHFQDGGHLLSWIFEILKLTQDRHLDCATCSVWRAREPAQKGAVCRTLPLIYSPAHGTMTSLQGCISYNPETSGVQDCMSCTSVAGLNSTMYLSASIQLISEHGRPHLCSSSNRILAVLHTYQFWWQKFRCYGTVAVEWSTS